MSLGAAPSFQDEYPRLLPVTFQNVIQTIAEQRELRRIEPQLHPYPLDIKRRTRLLVKFNVKDIAVKRARRDSPIMGRAARKHDTVRIHAEFRILIVFEQALLDLELVLRVLCIARQGNQIRFEVLKLTDDEHCCRE